MQILSIQCFELCIPFKSVFKHSAAERHITSSLWVKLETQDGICAFGESCPRTYVTGEDINSARTFVEQHKNEIIHEIHSLQDLQLWVIHNRKGIDKAPAAFCCLELAILDALAQEQSCSVEALLGLVPLDGTFIYSAVLSDASIVGFRSYLERYAALGLSDYKMKLSGDLVRDNQKCDQLLGFSQYITRLRLDANNFWRNTSDVLTYCAGFAFDFWAIEEPLSPFDFTGMLEIAAETGRQIILDESFLNLNDFPLIQEQPECWVINLRVSKMGGILRSLEIAQAAADHGIPIIIGAQVGETSLLTRAALCVAQGFSHPPLAREGAFGSYLLQEDVMEPSLMFHQGGVLDVSKLEFALASGFGLKSREIHGFLQ